MRRRFLLSALIFIILTLPSGMLLRAQDGLNLPTELYILLNSGVVQRYGLGVAGVVDITPEADFVIDFAVGPDNDLLAYRTEAGLTLYRMSTDSDIQLEADTAGDPPIRGRGVTMAWAAQGDALAYSVRYGVRVMFDSGAEQPTFADIQISAPVHLEWSPGGRFLAVEVEDQIWWIYRRDGTTMTLTSALTSSYGIAWRNDSLMLFAPADGGLIQMDLANGNQQTVLRDGSTLFRLPFILPDGSLAVFTRAANEATLDAGLFYRQLFGVSNTGTVSAGEPSLVAVDLTGVRWAPGGDVLLKFESGTVSLVLPMTGEGFTLPVSNAVAYNWGAPFPASTIGFTTTYSGFFIAPDPFGIRQIWRLPRNGTAPEQLTVAESDITDYAVMDAGAGLAYFSAEALWFLPLDPSGTAGNANRLAVVDASASSLDFSAEGGTLVYGTNAGVWSVAINGGEPALILEADATQIRPSIGTATGSVLAVISSGADDNNADVQVIDGETGNAISVTRASDALWLADGRVIGFGTDANGESTISVYTLNQPDATGAVLRSANTILLEVKEVTTGNGGTLRAILRNNTRFSPSPSQMIQVSVNSGEADDIANIGFLTDPNISPDGLYVAGYTGANGGLVIYDLVENQTLTLITPTLISNFQWATFR
ncbi:MAG: hypothetical protein RLP44_23760 [Aggregatilineales bacterium]